MSWVNVGAAAVSAGAGLYASNKASDAQAKGGKNAIAAQQQMFNTGLRMLEPQRGLGYGAMSDLASLYGYALPAYTPLNALMSPASGTAGGSSNWAVGQPIDIKGTKGKENRIAGFDVNPLSNSKTRLGGMIDPTAGTVTVDHNKVAKQDKFSDRATNYLRGDLDELKGGKFKRIRSAIDALREGGYQWSNTPPPQTAGPIEDGAGNFDRFFTSPGYTFRRDEGQRDIGNSFAARGGAASGNALRALTEFNQGLASQEFGNYQNALFNMAGMGQTATNQAIGVGQNTANNVSGLQQGIGDSRASGVMGGANSVMGAVNTGLDGYYWNKYLNSRNAGSVPTNSLYGPYAGGYRFPG